MKRKDIALIVVIVVFAGILSLLISNAFFTPDSNKSLEAEIADPITAEFQQPDPRVFNEDAINPTKLIQIGDSNNKQPF